MSTIPLSASLCRRLDGHCLTKCNILSLDRPITDESLILRLTGAFAWCGIGRLRVEIFMDPGWGRLDQGKHVIVKLSSALAGGPVSNAKRIDDPIRWLERWDTVIFLPKHVVTLCFWCGSAFDLSVKLAPLPLTALESVSVALQWQYGLRTELAVCLTANQMTQWVEAATD